MPFLGSVMIIMTRILFSYFELKCHLKRPWISACSHFQKSLIFIPPLFLTSYYIFVWFQAERTNTRYQDYTRYSKILENKEGGFRFINSVTLISEFSFFILEYEHRTTSYNLSTMVYSPQWFWFRTAQHPQKWGSCCQINCMLRRRSHPRIKSACG